jgi:trigger factor
VGETTIAVKVEDISSVKKKLLFDISWVDVKNELEACYRDVNRKAKIKGFRPGKVPRKILESMYKDHVEGEAITNLVNKYYWNAVKEKGIVVVAQPEIDQNGIEEEKNFVFEATVEVEPIIEPKNYVGLKLEKLEKEVTEDDVESRLQQIRQMFGTMEEVTDDREAKKGDYAVIDFKGTLEGETLKEMTSENYLLEIGSGAFVQGFEDQITGMRKDQTKSIQVKFPDGYGIQRLAGKEVEFSVSLKSIKARVLPEIDENFIRNFDKFETLEELRNDIRETLKEENMAKSDTELKDQIVTKLLESNDFEAPPSFIERQIQFMLADTRRAMSSRGLSRKEIDELSGKYREAYREEASRVVKSVLLMKNIAAKESISVNDGELDDKIMAMAQRRGQDFESLKKSLQDADMIENIKEEILTKKAFDFVEGKATIHKVTHEEIRQGGK